MIMGIISLIIFIVGFLLLFYGSSDDGDLLLLTLGIIMCSFGFLGITAFIFINLDTIKNWFTI